jgi:2-haloacid dehalogenase
MPIRAFVFDAYGTLFDVHSAIGKLREKVGADAASFSELWRVKQLEYSWTQALMGQYVPFWTITERALDFCFGKFPRVSRDLKTNLLEAYRELSAYPDARSTLETLRARGKKTAILSNGSRNMLEPAVRSANLTDLLDFSLSVDDVRTFKPFPKVYDLAINALSMKPSEIAFISSNRWDIAGSKNAGFHPVWINRAGNPDEYPDSPPIKIVKSLGETLEVLGRECS